MVHREHLAYAEMLSQKVHLFENEAWNSFMSNKDMFTLCWIALAPYRWDLCSCFRRDFCNGAAPRRADLQSGANLA